jgi:hypothetical protein
MSELQKTLGQSTVTLQIGETAYKLAPFTIEDYGNFENWLQENAWSAVRRAYVLKWITPEEFDRHSQNCIRLIASEKLSYGSDAYGEASMSYRGMEKLLAIALAKTHPNVSEKQIHEFVHNQTKEVAKALHENDEVSQ